MSRKDDLERREARLVGELAELEKAREEAKEKRAEALGAESWCADAATNFDRVDWHVAELGLAIDRVRWDLEETRERLRCWPFKPTRNSAKVRKP